ncbi:6,7-dimethyl-8-ribityllumazine synthase [Planctomycetales bacterium 10988]|nr:6,7-dimethyl-8-ribityllumazine synthase [Planctomycetales bacterium 10988]
MSSASPTIIEPVQELSPENRYAIVVARYNESITSKLLDGAIQTFKEKGVLDSQIEVAWVPGSFELPLIAEQMCSLHRYVAVLCLGAVIRGETTHDQHINRAVSDSLMQIGLRWQVPVLFGVLTCQNVEQAIARAGGRVGNKGSECADAAIQLVQTLEAINNLSTLPPPLTSSE